MRKRICIQHPTKGTTCGAYEERDGMVHVHFDGRKKSTQIGNLRAENLAVTILREMVASAA
ncbi:hypothetical protein R5H32_05730 [Defluviimonas sp. D31]|uniref:hypothetical protein n=1 Tax=Defluviimonas sp. D31 TaxID=3083253 RepID=UPI00296FC9E6|nr:hypothetical protein [Defluviimonas sp. D31]MDW4548849.1 hypothetical protein [Defluviimonas sp. D31]